jgi:hypothetical protein
MASSSGGASGDFSAEDIIAATRASEQPEELRQALLREHNMSEIETEPDGYCLWACLCLYLGLAVQECLGVRQVFVEWMVRFFWRDLMMK